MGRYTLTTGALHVPNFEKSDLKEIDMYTTQFENEEELLSDSSLTGNAWITYQHNGEKKLGVAYSDKSVLTELSYLQNNKINPNNIEFRRIVSEFLEQVVLDQDFYNYVMYRYKLLNQKVKESIASYKSARKFANPDREEDSKDIDTKEDIVCYFLGDYSQFRNVLFVMGEYKGYINELEAKRLEEEALKIHEAREDEEKESRQEEFFTAEDYDKPENKEYILTQNIPLPDSLKYKK